MANKLKFSPLKSAVVALILWIFSFFIGQIMPLVVILFLAITIVAGFQRSAAVQILGSIESGKTKVSWDWTDWGGLILLILIIAALIKGINPVELIKIIKPFFSSSAVK